MVFERFSKHEITRLDENELRDFYCDIKKTEKTEYVMHMIVSSIISLGSLAGAFSLYFKDSSVLWWGGLGIFGALMLFGFIMSLKRFSWTLEEIFINKVDDPIKQGRIEQ